jgi:VWFA-related protein
LSTGRRPDDVVAVFTIDLALHTVQPFTRDLEQIKTAFDRVRTQGHTQFASQLEDTRRKLDQINAVDSLEDSVSGTGGPGSEQISGSIGGAMAARQATAIQVQVARAFESLERDQQGYATTNALLAVVSGLKQLPGRKTVVFFSEGMVIPANVQDQFRSMIHSANRANVAVYTVDAGGLHAKSVTEEGREEMMQAMRRRMRQLESGRDDATGGAMTKAMERNEDLLRLNPEAGLGQLAQQTGGFLIRDTNDASEGFSRIEEDMRFHYILSYTPSNENYDGRFRQISVKVKRSGAAVHSRDGYFAVRPEGATPMLSYEAPALVQLDKSPRPSAFPLQVTGLSFPEAKRPGLVPVLVEVPGTAMTYATDKENKQMQRADFAIVVRVKDGSQQTVDRMSQHYVLTAAPNQVANAQKGAVLFYRETDLQPGRYTIEAVGYDAVANKASVKTSTLDVPANREGNLRISSLVLVKRIEDVPERDKNPSNSNPLFYGQTLIYPNLGDPVRRSAQQMLSFYFTAYSDQAATAARRAAVEVRRGGQAVGQATMELPTPDSNGRIQHAGVLPIQSFTPGAYELKVTVADGRSLATTSAPFTVEE